jgi:hypothetical protein
VVTQATFGMFPELNSSIDDIVNGVVRKLNFMKYASFIIVL